MWNPWKKLTDTDAARLRRVEARLLSVEDDVTKSLVFCEKINARLRVRARRAADEADQEEEESRGDASAPTLSLPAAPTEAHRMTREELMTRARAKGLR